MNRPDLAEIQWRRILDDQPHSSLTRRLLVEALLRGRRLTSAQLELAALQTKEQEGCEVSLLQARLAEARGEYGQARDLLDAVAARSPEDPAAWETLGRFLFEHGEPGEAIAPLSRLVHVQPDSGAALHNLGLAQLRVGDFVSAVNSLTELVTGAT